MNILVVEDDQQVSTMLKRYLSRQNHHVEHAVNGQAGWDLFSAAPESFDAILSDIKMPVMDGLAFCNLVRKNDFDVPIVIMTAYAELDYTIKALQLGALDFIQKPFEFETLEIALSKIESLTLPKQELAEILPHHTAQMQFLVPSHTKFIYMLVTHFQKHFKDICDHYKMNVKKIGLSLIEALTNAVIHGNLEVDSSLKEESWQKFNSMVKERELQPEYADRQVKFYYDVTAEKFEFVIQDQGKGFDISTLPEADDLFSMALSGRGIFLIRSFMDEVTWNETGNTIRMIKYLRIPEDPEA
ncbi:MAG: response regulator [SAR324 cluster bacterium]|nr:response regulator [SAR324 cluster bacterium]